MIAIKFYDLKNEITIIFSKRNRIIILGDHFRNHVFLVL